jgi:hypothetical protein
VLAGGLALSPTLLWLGKSTIAYGSPVRPMLSAFVEVGSLRFSQAFDNICRHDLSNAAFFWLFGCYRLSKASDLSF